MLWLESNPSIFNKSKFGENFKYANKIDTVKYSLNNFSGFYKYVFILWSKYIPFTLSLPSILTSLFLWLRLLIHFLFIHTCWFLKRKDFLEWLIMCLSSSKISEYDSAMFSTFCNNFSLIDGEKSLMLKIAKLCRFLSWMVINQSMTVLLFKSNKITLLIFLRFLQGLSAWRFDLFAFYLLFIYFQSFIFMEDVLSSSIDFIFYFVASFIVLSINIYIYIYIYICIYICIIYNIFIN